MALVPRTVVDKMQFYETHLPAFAADPSAIGLTPEQVATLQAKADAARAAYDAQQAAQQAARAATNAFNVALDELGTFGKLVLDCVRNYAKVTRNPNVYVTARLSSPTTPTSIASPGVPSGFSALLRTDGSLALKWQCKNPRDARGTMYEIARAVGPASPLERLAVVGKRRYVDASIPAGATEVRYGIRAFRSTGSGDWGLFTVNFGNNGNTPVVPFAKATESLAA